MDIAKRHYDLLVIGSGIGGLAAAISAAEAGASVLVLNKSSTFSECNTWYAQGGIVETGFGDSPDLLEQDILKAGYGINSREAVHVVATEGPVLVDEYLVKKAGVPFHQTETGEFDRTQEGAHSVRRILHVKDHTGRSIEQSLLDHIGALPSITCAAGFTAIDIITNTHHSTDHQERYRKRRALGAYVLDNATNEVQPVFAAAVILATGGVGNAYLHTSNPAGATGDGVAMAYRAGCDIINAEYVQFHPTVLFHRDVKRFLITEAMRGEGARLMNRQGEYFMSRYNSVQQDLAPRDEVARAIYHEMGGQGGYVLLDATLIKHVDVEQRFPSIWRQCKDLDIDLRQDPIPVVPAAHFFCGGVKVDLDGQTDLEGLYAVGENACNGVHGANRLASVSLLESLVFGVRAGRHIGRQLKPLDPGLLASIPAWQAPPVTEEFDPMLIQSDMASIQTTMWNYVGIIRTGNRLARAIADLSYLDHRIQSFYRRARINRDIVELRNAIATAMVIAQAAQKNRVSLGCHNLQDHPD
jgi:L-aspartate oxidase